MKILHVIPDLKQASGPSVFCVEVCERLAEKGDCVTILHEGGGGAHCLPKGRNVKVIHDFNNLSLDCGLPDIVQVHSLWSPLSHKGICYARKYKIPYVVSAHGMLAPWAIRHKWLKKKIAWWLYQKKDLQEAAMFHVTAQCEIEWLRGLGFGQPCVVASLGSDLPDLTGVESLRQKKVKTVLFVGRIYPVKGLVNLVKAWGCVKRTAADGWKRTAVFSESSASPRWQLVIAGPDQAGHKAEVVAEAKRVGLRVEDAASYRLISQSANQTSPPDLIFTGPVYGEDKDKVHRMADLFILPSFTENFGVVVTDALSYGIPVITTKGTPWAELLGAPGGAWGGAECGESASSFIPHPSALATFGRCGWWVDIGVEPLVTALKEAMSLSDEERQTMGANGRKLVEVKYTWPAITENVKHAYEWVLEKGPTPACIRVD